MDFRLYPGNVLPSFLTRFSNLSFVTEKRILLDLVKKSSCLGGTFKSFILHLKIDSGKKKACFWSVASREGDEAKYYLPAVKVEWRTQAVSGLHDKCCH